MIILYRFTDLLFRVFHRWRAGFLKSRMSCGKDVTIRENALIYCPERVNLADGVYIGPRVTIMAQGGVEIGEATMVGPGVSILSVNHDYTKPKPTLRGTQRKRPVVIGREVWLAGGSIILPGVTVGDNSAVSAGAVVNSDVPPNSIVAGNPAKLIRERFRGVNADDEALPLFSDDDEASPLGAADN